MESTTARHDTVISLTRGTLRPSSSRFANKFKLAELARVCGLAIKDKHTIIEKWPYNLKLRPGQAGAQEEFDRALRGSPSSKERYMEWKRVPAVHRSF